MELLNVARARSMWLFDINDLNPRGKSVLSDILEWLKNSYVFSKFPASINDQEAQTKALAFLQGNFQLREEFFIDVDLRLYNDGIIADTRSSTDDTDLFLNDVLESASKEFNLSYRPGLVRKKLYASEVNVRCDHPLSNLNPKLKAISDKLSTLVTTALPPLPPLVFDFSAISFWAELLTPTPVAFRFERKQNSSFSENRYYSSAPLQTPVHLSLLEELESILSG